MLIGVLIFLTLVAASALFALVTSRRQRMIALLRLNLTIALLCSFFYFFAGARLAVPYPDKGPVPTGHILEGVVAMFNVSLVFVATLSIIGVSSTMLALRLARHSGNGA